MWVCKLRKMVNCGSMKCSFVGTILPKVNAEKWVPKVVEAFLGVQETTVNLVLPGERETKETKETQGRPPVT